MRVVSRAACVCVGVGARSFSSVYSGRARPKVMHTRCFRNEVGFAGT